MKRILAAVCIPVMCLTTTIGTASAAKPPPPFNKVKQAIESTGLQLCDLSEPGNLSQRIFAQSTSGCPPIEAHGGLVRIYTLSSNAEARSEVPTFKRLGDAIWLNQTIMVASDNPAPGTNTALKKLGFKRA